MKVNVDLPLVVDVRLRAGPRRGHRRRPCGPLTSRSPTRTSSSSNTETVILVTLAGSTRSGASVVMLFGLPATSIVAEALTADAPVTAKWSVCGPRVALLVASVVSSGAVT